jgi:transcriptional regulator with XRE-family HTH domain
MKKFLKEGRRRSGLTQTQVAEKIGCNAQFVSNWERGVSKPPLAAWQVIIPLYNLDKTQLYRLLVEEAIDRVDMVYAMITGSVNLYEDRRQLDRRQG